MQPGKKWRRDREIRDNARELRQWTTGAEAVLWKALRGRRLEGLKFRRQYPIGEFIVDFYCETLRLCVELDGDYHEEPETAARDRWRQTKLEEQGYRVLRFTNDAVFADSGEVVDLIRQVAFPDS